MNLFMCLNLSKVSSVPWVMAREINEKINEKINSLLRMDLFGV